MYPDPTLTTLTAWSALLSLRDDERAIFLAAARAFDAATTMRSGLPVPALALARTRPSDLVVGARPDMLALTDCVQPHESRSHVEALASDMGGTPPALKIAATQHSGVLPLVGGAALDLAPRTAFREDHFVARWRPGARIGVYCAGNRRLADLVRPLRLNAYAVGSDAGVGKVGTARDIARRMADLGKSAHAGVSKADPSSVDPGFRNWGPEPLPIATTTPSPGSPVAVVGDGLDCVLPATLTANAFDKMLAKALASASLGGWANSADGQTLCAAHHVDPLTLIRGTPRSGGTVAWSTELVLIRPRHDALRLLRLCEQLIIDHVMSEPQAATPVAVKRDGDTTSHRTQPNARAKTLAEKPKASGRSARSRAR